MNTRNLYMLLLLSRIAFAQLGTPPAPPGLGGAAIQLPLSGRAGSTGGVSAAQTALPGITTSVNTLNTTVQVQGPYAGSASSTGHVPFSGRLSLREALERAVEYNLGAVGLSQAVRQVHGQQRVARSALLPNLNSALRENVQQVNLQALGVRIPIAPQVVGPFNYFDLRATLTQTVADLTALNNYRAVQDVARASRQSLEDARDLVVLAVGGAYLQAIAAGARVESARAQLATARALYQQTLDRRKAGLIAQVDVNRSLVEQQTQQQRLVTLENDLAKQKINLARLTGLPPNERYELTDDVPFSEVPSLTFEDALKQAFESRPDLQAAESQIRGAERARSAARAERLPSLALSADYGVIGTNPAQSHGTFTFVGTLRFPIWQGGRTEGNIEQAEAALDQRRAEFEDVRGRIESDLRNAFLDIQAAASQLGVARNNQEVSRQTLDLTRQRYESGIADAVELVQSQEGIATADLDYITALFAHNLAKLTLARALGGAGQNVQRFLNIH